jgi:hypothetical protein
VMQFNNRALLHFSSGIQFNSYLLETALPIQLPQGVIHQAILPLDFTPLSTFGQQLPPAWQGHWEGLQFLQLLTADFGGLQRAFALAVSEKDSSIQLWEIADYLQSDFNMVGGFAAQQANPTQPNGENRITTVIEFPAFTWDDEFQLKKLTSAELWFDRVTGVVDFNIDYREDSNPCWRKWHQWRTCFARNIDETPANPVAYPASFSQGFQSNVNMPLPQPDCDQPMGRPSNIGYQFQSRLSIKGYARVRGFMPKAEMVDSALYGVKVPC